ncbi:hypothetical protein A176_006075 [Myxococcus hansupus]|uniref:Uncharacterized protein n=1 Tax=Pseudomyxococcus hansupus TaxID=1297742 RepID=A0A0H4X5L1_9BACT|nr:hypothetical protein A176_006075 [Myxococcus hansupus]
MGHLSHRGMWNDRASAVPWARASHGLAGLAGSSDRRLGAGVDGRQ